MKLANNFRLSPGCHVWHPYKTSRFCRDAIYRIRLPFITCMMILGCFLLLTVPVHAQGEPTAVPVFPLQPGSTVEANISTASPTVLYSFEASEGDTVAIRMETTSGNLDPFLRLLGPAGLLVTEDDDSGGGRNAEITLTLAESGRHTIEASYYRQGGASSEGTFRLTLEIAGQGGGSPTDPLLNMPDFNLTTPPTLIEYQQHRASALADAGETQYFAFQGEKGDLVRAIMTATDSVLSPQADFRNADLLSIAASEVQPRPVESIAYATLPETGWYLVQAGARSGSGAFDVYIDLLVAGNVLEFGEALTSEFTPENPTISYIFNARIGDLISANMFALNSSSGISPELRLFDTNFQIIATAAGSRFATLRGTIPRSGTYILQANNANPQTTGGFNLRLTGTPLNIATLPIAPINYNERDRGFISSDEPINYYRFSGKAGERVTIQMTNTSGSLDPYLILTDATLTEELTFNDNVSATRNARIVRYRLDKDGDYLILATRAGLAEGTTTGGFDLALTVGDIALIPGSVSAELHWNAAADLNLFVRSPEGRTVSWSSPSVPSGGTLQIDSNTNCETPTDQPVEYIYWPEDTLVSGDYEIWAWYEETCGTVLPVPFSLEVNTNGTPILQIAPETNAATTLQLQPGQRFEATIRLAEDGTAFVINPGRISTPSAQQRASEGGDIPIGYGDSVTDTLNDNVYARFYQFQGKAGDEITLVVEPISGNLDPIVILRDSADNTLDNGLNDDATDENRTARLRYTLPEDGQYIIAITRFGVREGITSGTYRLTLNAAGY